LTQSDLHRDHPWPSARVGWYVVAVLLLGYTFSFVDRQVLNLLVEPIREDLGVSDTQISFLQGIAFVGTYVLMSVPIGRMVDRFHRVVILIGGVLAWSASTVGCGLSRTYAQLLFARMGVGAGEATLTPGSWSILADYFPPDRLARPMSVFLIGPYLGAGLALIAGAEVIAWTETVDELSVPLLGVIAPWQFTFIALGLPGAAIAALLATIREPKRIGSTGPQPEAVSWPEAWSLMIERRRVYAALLLGVPFIVVILYGLQAWVPTFLVRVYEWEISQAGRIYGLIALIAGSAGVLSGPYAAAWLQARGHRDHPLRLAVISGGLIMVSMVSLPWQESPRGALVCVACASFFVTLPLALMTMALQTVTPTNMRGLVAGLYVVTTNVIGLAIGPTLVASFTDLVFQDPIAVGQSLTVVSLLVAPVAMILLATGMKPYAARAALSESS
jgi:MFS family permease